MVNQPQDPTTAPAPSEPAQPSRRWRIPFRGWAALFVAALLGLLYGTEIAGDHAIANLALILLVPLLAGLLFVGYLRKPGRTWRQRFAALAAVGAAVALFLTLFRLEGFSGEMWPRFAFRFANGRSPAPAAIDTSIASQPTPEAVDLVTTTQADFPQFLGPGRSSSVMGVELDPDWQTHHPKLLWKRDVGRGWSGFAVVNGFALTLEQNESFERIICLDAASGDLRWAHTVEARYESLIAGDGPRSTPTVDEGRVYTLGATGHLCCLDGRRGELIWEVDLRAFLGVSDDDERAHLAYGRANSPLVVDDLVIVPAGGPAAGPRCSLAAFDKRNGDLVWKGGDRQVSYSSPVLAELAGRRQVLSVNEDTVSGHDPETGHVLWEFPWPGNSSQDASVSQPIAVGSDRVFLSKGYFRGAALVQIDQVDSGELEARELWHDNRLLKTKFTSAVIDEGYAYGLSDGILECVEIDSGRKAWKAGRYGHGQILRVGRHLLVLSESGEMHLIEISPVEKNKVLGSFQALEGKTWNTFALAGPLLFVRNAREAACYRLPLAGGNEVATP